jgi:F0F1-type ATP synthase assembly protein I
MVNNIPDGRSPIAVAMNWATQVTTISIEMVLPIVLGVWADRRLGTKVVFTILGAIAGLWLGIWSLIRMTRDIEEDEKKDKQGQNGKNEES